MLGPPVVGLPLLLPRLLALALPSHRPDVFIKVSNWKSELSGRVWGWVGLVKSGRNVCEEYNLKRQTQSFHGRQPRLRHWTLEQLTMLFEIWNMEIWSDVSGIWEKRVHRALQECATHGSCKTHN